MSRKGRRPWQEKSYRETHELLEKILVQAVNGINKTQLRQKTQSGKETMLSRPTIDKHLNDFKDEQKVERSGSLYFWGRNILIQLERYRLIEDIRDKQEKADAIFETNIALAQTTLKGEELRKKLDELYLEELGWREQFLKAVGAEEKAAMVKDAIKLFRQLERTPSVEGGLGIMRKYEAQLNREKLAKVGLKSASTRPSAF